MTGTQHEPVLLKETLEYLDPKPGEFIIDGTLDGGGHAAVILEKVKPSGKLLGVDWDEAMAEKAQGKFEGEPGIFRQGNFADLPEILKHENLGKADGLLLDLGFSSEQLAGSQRGFSFAADEPLLMTYDRKRIGVKDILRQLREGELADVIYEFGEERFSRQIAHAIKERLRHGKIETSGELAETIANSVPKNYEHFRMHPATRTFQALRIYANDELGNLKKILTRLAEVLKPDGRVIIISFHSLEDRIVKQAFKHLEREGGLEILTSKPIFPSHEEVIRNQRSRSAKLRAAKMK
jgi:16S rRNA (cytosine1402-N4)-methyltransferase